MRIRIDYIKKDKNGEKYHVEKKDDGFFESWVWIGKFKTLSEAEEFGKSRDAHIIYEGVYENGKRIGMTGWEDDVEMNTRKFPEVANGAEIIWIHKGKTK